MDKLVLFNAWLEGYSLHFVNGVPSKSQYEVILNKLKELSTHPIPKVNYFESIPEFPPFVAT